MQQNVYHKLSNILLITIINFIKIYNIYNRLENRVIRVDWDVGFEDGY